MTAFWGRARRFSRELTPSQKQKGIKSRNIAENNVYAISECVILVFVLGIFEL